MTILARPPTTEENALAVVNGEWRTAREIFAIVDEGAFSTTRTALAKLADEGKIERRYEPHPAGEIARYRKAREPS